MPDDDRTPEELREDADKCRERAEQAAEVRDLASEASSALSALAEHEYLTDRATYQVDLLEQTLGHIRHGEAWGQDAHLLEDHAHRLETRAGRELAAVERARELMRRREAAEEPTGTWILPPDAEEYHHSIRYDGHEHETACGLTFDEAPFGVVMEPEALPEDGDYCPDCLAGGEGDQ